VSQLAVASRADLVVSCATVRCVSGRLGGNTYRITIASMGDGPCIPLRRSNREAAGIDGDETLPVALELDAETRDQAARRPARLPHVPLARRRQRDGESSTGTRRRV